MKKYKIIILFSLLSTITIGQTITPDVDLTGSTGSRRIQSAVPFLTIAPDARGSSFGDVGAATTPDINSGYWNPAKYTFTENHAGVGLSYTPWLRKLINDMSISYLSAYTKISADEAIYFHMKYFDLGSMTFRDESNQIIKEHNPYEIAIGGGYTRKLSDKTSVGLGLKYIRSDIAGNISLNGGSTVTKPANSVGVDVFIYQQRDITIKGNKIDFAWGGGISDIGPKISYTDGENSDYLPTNLRLGAQFTHNIDLYNKITWMFDINKLLVPTPPVYYQSTSGGDSLDASGNQVIFEGKDPDRGLMSAMFGSLTDAPGGFKEEMQEVILATGFEYWYADAFAARVGYHYENPAKGNKSYIQFGIGMIYKKMGLDLSYLLSLSKNNNPIQDTLRFSLFLNIDKKNKGEELPTNQ